MPLKATQQYPPGVPMSIHPSPAMGKMCDHKLRNGKETLSSRRRLTQREPYFRENHNEKASVLTLGVAPENPEYVSYCEGIQNMLPGMKNKKQRKPHNSIIARTIRTIHSSNNQHSSKHAVSYPSIPGRPLQIPLFPAARMHK
jgi:hypothetical protein